MKVCRVDFNGLTCHSRHTTQHSRGADHGIETGGDTRDRFLRRTCTEYPGIVVCSVKSLPAILSAESRRIRPWGLRDEPHGPPQTSADSNCGQENSSRDL